MMSLLKVMCGVDFSSALRWTEKSARYAGFPVWVAGFSLSLGTAGKRAGSVTVAGDSYDGCEKDISRADIGPWIWLLMGCSGDHLQFFIDIGLLELSKFQLFIVRDSQRTRPNDF
mmetsp:Transcript_14224/g.57265  ORF Transcript_14224/g.57265 Transcript_14224/m.57265 type:complete len:115 (-) Transcript_14224:1805-2149(-)